MYICVYIYTHTYLCTYTCMHIHTCMYLAGPPNFVEGVLSMAHMMNFGGLPVYHLILSTFSDLRCCFTCTAFITCAGCLELLRKTCARAAETTAMPLRPTHNGASESSFQAFSQVLASLKPLDGAWRASTRIPRAGLVRPPDFPDDSSC